MPGANLATPSDQADLICDEINDRGDPSQPQANTEEEGMGLNNDATMEDARPATERRRNAQASARFRKRRREREQDMMNTIESMRGEVHELKIRVQELRAENRLLRDILKTNGPRSAG